MGVKPAIFESVGKRTEHTVPGVYNRSTNVTSASSVSSGKLCLIGSSAGGKPLKVQEFGSLAEAQAALVSGDLLESVALAFNGSKDFIPQSVLTIPVNDGACSTLELKSTSNVLMTIKAWDWGTHTNQLRMKIETGSLNGSKKVTFVYKDETIEVDNIIKKSLSIVSGAENATITINETSLILDYENETEPKKLTLAFEDFPKLSDLVERINIEEDFTASLLDSDESALSANLDFVQAQSITTTTTIYSNRKAFADAISNVKFVGDVILSSDREVPENMSFTYFTGGQRNVATVDNWVSALEILETEDIQIIASATTDGTIQNLIANHCTKMSTTENRKERTCFLGGSIGLSDDNAIAAAIGFNNKLVSFVVDNPIIANAITGEIETVSGAKLGVMLAGIESAMAVNNPITNKTLNVLGFSKKRTITNMSNLIKGGVIVCNPSPDDATNYVCIRGVTTYQGDDLLLNERSMVREDLYMNRDLRTKLNKGIGSPNKGSTAKILSTLNDAAKEWADLGYIIPDGANNVWNKTIKIDGDKIYLTYSRYLTAPTNFIFVTASNHVYTSTQEV